jgi:hypothetical protein
MKKIMLRERSNKTWDTFFGPKKYHMNSLTRAGTCLLYCTVYLVLAAIALSVLVCSYCTALESMNAV